MPNTGAEENESGLASINSSIHNKSGGTLSQPRAVDSATWSQNQIKVHLGAFDQGIDGWINGDITPHLYISRMPLLPFCLYKLGVINKQRYTQHQDGVFRRLSYLDLTKPLPYPDNYVSAFFSSHVLEHLFLGEIVNLVREMHRCLGPGGVCRVVVPDLAKIVSDFDADNPERFLTQIFEAESRGAVKNAHHWGFTAEYLIKIFSDAGFSECGRQEYRIGKCPDVERLDNRPDSLFFEAYK